ncbi:Zinc finger BED domain-containing protein 1 [Merluccius polli]|uniref:Zinc finger BED domain-containing protein 1 n=1 Tax=Merluccius polli TaxID=89951 RepID=A0AA47MUW2_MERPO|nr:Zinc finger BED domain-containing protein 1 [Merluccius polli]
MAEREQPKMDKIRLAPPSLKASVWKHFSFHEVEGKRDLEKSHTVCKLCLTKIKYFGNTTNMRNHISRFHPELEERQPVVVAANQRTIEQLTKLSPDSERAKVCAPTQSMTTSAFRGMLHTLELRYPIPSQRFVFFTNTTSIATESYVTITAHFITDDWQLVSHVLQTRAMYESHMGANVAELLQKCSKGKAVLYQRFGFSD